jgi:hypothetical protein
VCQREREREREGERERERESSFSFEREAREGGLIFSQKLSSFYTGRA